MCMIIIPLLLMAAVDAVVWCDWGDLSWTKMRPLVGVWNASPSGGNGVVDFECVTCNANLSQGLTDWGLWLERDLRKGSNGLCDFLALGGSIAAFQSDDLLEDLTDYVNTDPRFDWEDLSFSTRRFVAESQGRVTGIPFSAEFPLFFYRRDLIAVPPATWEDAIALGERLNGTDMNGDGTGDWAFCFDGYTDVGRTGIAVVASIMQYATGTWQGYMYDLNPDDATPMVPLFDTVGYEYALDIISRMYALSARKWDDYRWVTIWNYWFSGRCAMYYSWAGSAGWAGMTWTSVYRRQGATRPLGSRIVYDRTTKQLVNCTLALCPYMESGGVNRPSLQMGGNRFVVRKNPSNIANILSTIAVATSTSGVDPRDLGNTPYRDSHYNVSWWVEKGWDYTDATLFLFAFREASSSLHMARMVAVQTFEDVWRLLEDGMKEAARAGSYANSTRSRKEIVVDLALKSEAAAAKGGWTLADLEASLRQGNQMSPLRVPTPQKPYWIIPVAIAGVAAVVVAVVLRVKRYLATAGCPKDEKQPFTVLFVGLKNEVQLADCFPETMKDALDHTHSVIRRAAARNRCYVARRIGNVTMLVSQKSGDAVNCAVEILRELDDRRPWSSWFNEDVGNLKTLRVRNNDTESKTGSKRSLRESGSHRNSRSQSQSQSQSRASRHSTGSSHTVLGFVEFRLLPNMGLWSGVGSIVYEEERNLYSYSGVPVDAAAELADFAKGRQIVATAEFVDEADVEGRYQGHFSAVGSRRMRTRGGQEYELHQCTPPGMMPIDASNANRTHSDDEEASGAIAGALQLAAGGLCVRRVAVAVLLVEELRNRKNAFPAEDHAVRCRAVLTTVADLAAAYKVHVLSMTDGQIVVAGNALAPASGAISRVAHVALEAIEALHQQGYSSVSAGLAAGAAVAGTVEHSTLHNVLCGCVVERATDFQRLSAALGGAIISSASMSKELSALFYTQSVDFVQSAPEDPPAIVHLVAVMEARPEAEEDEWMYQLEKGDAMNPYRYTNGVFADIERTLKQNAVAPLDDRAAWTPSSAAFLAMLRGESPLVEDAKIAASGIGAGRVAHLAALRSNTELTQYAEQRRQSLLLLRRNDGAPA